MRKDRHSCFSMIVGVSELHKIKYVGVNSAMAMDTEVQANINNKIRIFTDFHISIVPNVPVILFELEDINSDVGSPVFNLDLEGRALYHLPDWTYPYLEDIVKDAPFIISYELLRFFIEKNKVHASIFSELEGIREELGLVVLGLHHAIE